METKGARLKKFLLAIVLGVLLLPFIQQHLKLVETDPLEGAITPAEPVWFSVKGWLSGKYQQGYETWFNENFGFRPDLVRFHNQLAYDLYHQAKANGIVFGKDGYLYELNYIRALTAEDYVGYAKLDSMTDKLKTIQDSLEKSGTTLLICLAPGKASFYPEYIPDEYGKGADTTNNSVFSQMLIDKNINCIDYNSWFKQMKGKTPYLLYPKTGVHWSRYGSTLAIDSLIRYVEHKRHVDLPSMIMDSVVVSDSLRAPDEDIARGMNLLFRPKGLPMGYPEYHFEDTTGKAHLSMMTISDSFFWSMYDIGLAPKAFSRISFYYYYKDVYRTGEEMQKADVETSMSDMKHHDVVVLMATECTVWGIGWGFINDAFNDLALHKVVQSEEKIINKYEALIRKDEKWMSDIRRKADDQQISLDSMIYLDAKYMAEQDMKKAK